MSQIIKNLVSGGPIPPEVPTSFVANSGIAIPAANILNVPGNNTANNGFATFTTGAASTLTINSYGTAKWVVNPIAGVGTHQTIQGAINSAVSGETIFITPGTYTENINLKSGVNLTAYDCDSGFSRTNFGGYSANVTIKGKLTANDFNSSNICSISNLCLETNGDFVLAITGTLNTVVFLNQCLLRGTNASLINMTSSFGFLQCNDTQATLNTTGISYFNISNNSKADFYYCDFNNPGGSTTASIMTDAGNSFMWYTVFPQPLTLSGSAQISIIHGKINGTITANNSSQVEIYNSFVGLPTNNTPVVTLNDSTPGRLVNCVIGSSNANAISGTGVLTYGGLFFTASNNISVTTQIPLIQSNDAVRITRPAAYPYTVVAQDEVISVDTSGAAPTVNLPASPANGQKHTVKDRSANAAASNITVSGNGHNIVGTASAATQVISLNGASVTYVYDSVGTVWLAI